MTPPEPPTLDYASREASRNPDRRGVLLLARIASYAGVCLSLLFLVVAINAYQRSMTEKGMGNRAFSRDDSAHSVYCALVAGMPSILFLIADRCRATRADTPTL